MWRKILLKNPGVLRNCEQKFSALIDKLTVYSNKGISYILNVDVNKINQILQWHVGVIVVCLYYSCRNASE